MAAIMLSTNFSLEEFVASQQASRLGISNIPQGQELDNLHRTAEVMERVRSILGDKPVLISSGYRCRMVNRAVGGSTTSAHMKGLAVDFIVPGFGDPLAICKALEPHVKELGIDQLAHEHGAWVHLAIAAEGEEARCHCLTIDNAGTRHGFA